MWFQTKSKACKCGVLFVDGIGWNTACKSCRDKEAKESKEYHDYRASKPLYDLFDKSMTQIGVFQGVSEGCAVFIKTNEWVDKTNYIFVPIDDIEIKMSIKK